VGMVLFLVAFARYLGVSRKQHSFGIALGFGTFAVVELALIASWAGDHLGSLTMSLVNMSAYNLALLIWLGYTVAPSPAREEAATLLRPQRWEQSLSDIQHPIPGDSLIPMFENMVDRALSRTQAPAPAPAENAAGAAAAAGAASRGAAVPMSAIGIVGLVDRVTSKR
jgi:hypothetical protein